MPDNRKTRYAIYNINYHFVWIPKYRKRVLVGPVRDALLAMLGTIAARNGMQILAVEVMPDHVHLFVSAPPRYSPAWIVNAFKGASARWLRERLPLLKRLIRDELWTRTYYVGTAGTVSSETVKRYIENQTGD